MNIVSAMASRVSYFYCCLLLTQHKYYFWNSAAFAFSSIDLTVKQNIYYLYASLFSQIPTKPAKSRCYMLFNILVPGRYSNYFKIVIFLFMLQNEFLSTSCEIALRCMAHNPIGRSTLVQVMAWCCQATNHYLSQCWPRSMSPYGVTMPQWVDICVYISNTFFYFCAFLTFPFMPNLPGVSSTATSHPWTGTVSSNIAKKGAEFISQFV